MDNKGENAMEENKKPRKKASEDFIPLNKEIEALFESLDAAIARDNKRFHDFFNNLP